MNVAHGLGRPGVGPGLGPGLGPERRRRRPGSGGLVERTRFRTVQAESLLFHPSRGVAEASNDYYYSSGNDTDDHEHEDDAPSHSDGKTNKKSHHHVGLYILCILVLFFILRAVIKWGAAALEHRVEKYLVSTPRIIHPVAHAPLPGHHQSISTSKYKRSLTVAPAAASSAVNYRQRRQSVGGVSTWQDQQQVQQQQQKQSLLLRQRQLEMEPGSQSLQGNVTNVTTSATAAETRRSLQHKATMCVSSNHDSMVFSGPVCRVQPCPTHANQTLPISPPVMMVDSGSSLPPPPLHYGNGFVFRPESLRNKSLSMTLSGQAKSGSGCAISHKYQFIYIHVLKSGGMTLKTFLKQGLCHNSTKMPCQAGDDVLQIVSCRTAVTMHPHYFVWSFVRNPYGRMYSTYAMALEYRTTSRKGKPELPPFTFADFVFANMTRSNSNGNTMKRGRFHNPLQTARRRLQSLQHRPGRMGINKEARSNRRFMTYMDLVHCQPQHAFLFDRHDCPVFDFLGHLESFAQDLKTVVDTIASPELTLHYHAWHNKAVLAKQQQAEAITNTSTITTDAAATDAAVVTLHKDKSTSFGTKHMQEKHGGSLQAAYQSTPGLQQAVAKQYAKDFVLFGYDMAVVPP